MKIIYARFVNLSRDLIEYCTEDGSSHLCTYDPHTEECKRILKDFNIQSLEKNYIDFSAEMTKQHEYFKKFQENIGAITAIIDKRWHDLPEHSEITEGMNLNIEVKDISIENIIDIGNDEEKFFRFKLKTFELPEVKACSNNDIKSKMRKSSTSLELLANLYEVYCLLDNEQAESQD